MISPAPLGGVERLGRSPRLRVQRGSSLVEVMIAVAIVSILLLGVMAGMSTSATVSRSTGQAVKTRAALATVTDRIATMAYPGCGDAAAMDAAVHAAIAIPDGYDAEVTGVENLLPTGGCSSDTSVRLLRVRVDHPASSNTLTGEVVVRDRAARP